MDMRENLSHARWHVRLAARDYSTFVTATTFDTSRKLNDDSPTWCASGYAGLLELINACVSEYSLRAEPLGGESKFGV